jgi:hypothetical protein
MLDRMMGAVLFRPETYEEIEADAGAMGQAFGMVLLVTGCGIAGGIVDKVISGETFTALGIVLAVVGGLFFGIARWALWVTLLLVVGGSMLRSDTTQTSWSELGRVVGFAYIPGVLSLLTFIPEFGDLFWIIGFFWTLAAVVVAVRHALDYDSVGRAIGVVLITGILGFIPWIIIKAIEWSIT